MTAIPLKACTSCGQLNLIARKKCHLCEEEFNVGNGTTFELEEWMNIYTGVHHGIKKTT